MRSRDRLSQQFRVELRQTGVHPSNHLSVDYTSSLLPENSRSSHSLLVFGVPLDAGCLLASPESQSSSSKPKLQKVLGPLPSLTAAGVRYGSPTQYLPRGASEAQGGDKCGAQPAAHSLRNLLSWLGSVSSASCHTPGSQRAGLTSPHNLFPAGSHTNSQELILIL